MGLAEEIFDYSQNIEKLLGEKRNVEELEKRIVDSIFVSYGARSSPAVKASKEALLPSEGRLNSPIYFENSHGAVDVSTFINGCMTRYLDYNDTYLSKEALHPSDNIPPLLSYGYALGKSGEDLLKSLAAAYQTVTAFSDAFSIRDRGWDHVTYISISSAVGLAVMNSFNKEKFIHTLNLAVNNNISLRQTRAGELSMWKGCTAANASRNSVFAAMLAGRGFTGPSPIFEGEMGFFKQVTGNISVNLEENRIPKTMIKNFPVEYHAMSAVEAALHLREEINGEKIKAVNVDTFSVAHKIIVKDPEKLRPKTKETADHSMPYLIAYSLLYGEPDPSSFEQRYLRDPSILSIMDVTKFNISQDYDNLYPEYLPVRISVRTESGDHEKEVKVPKGHFRNPYTWEDMEEKGIKIMKDEKRVGDIIGAGKILRGSTIRDFMKTVSAG